jgi:hypothetical protein
MPSPHTLAGDNVRRTVEDDLGVYVLYDDRDGPRKYVGRSSDLRSRILDHAESYGFLSYEPHPNQTEAYEVEVEAYHEAGGKERLDNDRHPQRPHKNVKCHLCDVHG